MIRKIRIVVLFYLLLHFEVNSQKRVYLKGSLFNTSQATLSHWYMLGQTWGATGAKSLLSRGSSPAQVPAWVCSLSQPGCRHLSGGKVSSDLSFISFVSFITS